MFFGDFITHLSIAILSGYLSLSGALANSIEHGLVAFHLTEELPHVVESSPPPQTGHKTEALLPSSLPSHYETGGLIPKILLDNLEYQQAAVAGAGTSQTKPQTESVQIEDALVNVFCAYRDGASVRATSGSGVFVSDKGVILTNAHVAQFLLIGQFKQQARCTVRTGNPARERYTADLLYISPAWVYENAKLIDSKAPQGTGERDYALLYVTQSLDGPLPERFPALALDTTLLTPGDRGHKVRAAGYPAEIFKEEGPRADLVPKIASTTLVDLFTFGSGEADLVAIGETPVGEEGASGGPIVSKDGKVMGLIVTKGDENKEGARSLRALTLPYINRTLKEETGFDLRTTLEGNIARRGEIFKKALVPFLASLLKNELH